MYMRIGNEKILIKRCRFDKNDEWVEVNKRFLISDEGCFDSEETLNYDKVNIHGVDYDCRSEFEKINELLGEM